MTEKMNEREKWQKYSSEKQKIINETQSAEEYDRKIYELVEKLEI